MFYKCQKCGKIMEMYAFKNNMNICTKCGNHAALTYDERLKQVLDEDSFLETNHKYGFENPIGFPDYENKYKEAVKKTNMKEAIITGVGNIYGIEVSIGVMDNRFMMGSMGSVVGEKITRLFEDAYARKIPVIIFSTSGGARMQEGMLALMQMAKTSSAIAKFNDLGGLYISVLTNPTTGGVSASFAFLGDIILAEPNAVIGFAGKRVIEQTMHESLPEDFQTAEYLLKNGFLDAIVERSQLKHTLYQLLKYHRVDNKGVSNGCG